MEKETTTVGMHNHNYKIIDYGHMLDYQEERISVIHHLHAVASGNGDEYRKRELRNLLFIEEDILAEMQKKFDK